MLASEELKSWLHRDLRLLDKLLIVLATFEKPCEIKHIKERAIDAGYKIPKKANLSTVLSRSKGLAIKIPAGWELSDAGRTHLGNLGVGSAGPAVVQATTDLRAHLMRVEDSATRAFVEEAIKALEYELHRSAVVMSWIAAVSVLHQHVLAHHLDEFNAESVRVDSKWKPARTVDDLGRMKEADFLDRIAAISVIGKSVKAALKECLDRRNGCGHPNSLKLGEATVTHHIELLLSNVFERFA